MINNKKKQIPPTLFPLKSLINDNILLKYIIYLGNDFMLLLKCLKKTGVTGRVRKTYELKNE